jgi:hypothetical protein
MSGDPLTPPRDELSLNRALRGACVVTGSLWLSPVVFNSGFTLALAAWGAAMFLGLLYVGAGFREARVMVPPSLIGGFWSCAAMLGIAALWFYLGAVPDDPVWAYVVRGVYVTGLAVIAIYFWIVSGLGVRSALRVMNRQMRRRNAPLRAARSRRGFFFWRA